MGERKIEYLQAMQDLQKGVKNCTTIIDKVQYLQGFQNKLLACINGGEHLQD